jgi:tRNA-Thr(GGU) m(6)t(6)A37 methyltransferase TsaA
MQVCYSPIGIIHSGFKNRESVPIQGVFSSEEGFIEIFPVYKKGLKDLEGFSHLFLLYHFHKAGPPKLTVIPFLDREKRGIFATRHHDRPNPLGLSVVELVSIQDSILRIKGVDILDGTPLLDIKPYVRQFDVREPVRCGWIDTASPDAGKAGEYTPEILHAPITENNRHER